MAKIGSGGGGALKTCVGAVLMLLLPARRRRVERLATIPWHAEQAPDALDRLIRQGVFWWRGRGRGGEGLGALHRDFWARQSAGEYYDGTASRFAEVFLPHFDPLLSPLVDELRVAGIETAIEIGCGDGQLLRHLRERLPLRRCVGLDLSADQIARNRTATADPAITYHAGDATAWIAAQAPPGALYVTGLGVLEYFPQAALQTLLEHIARRPPALLFLSEPVAEGVDYARFDDSFVAGEERSFTHNYPARLRQAGFSLLAQHAVRVRDYRWDVFIARY